MASNADDFWAGFGEDQLEKVDCDSSQSLAKLVMDAFGIPCNSSIGGGLPNLDIKHMDALQVVKMSLLEETANTGEIYEIVMTPEGEVDFIAIGQGEGPTDIYYEIQTSTYKEDCSGVMVVGHNPMSVRKKFEWAEIWEGGDMQIYETGRMYSTCAAPGFNQYCTIVYDDPHLNSQYKDGIDNLYEINEQNPWDTIIGYANFMYWPDWQSDKDAVINKSDSAKILIEIPDKNIGTLRKRPIIQSEWAAQPACFDGQGEEINGDGGVEIPLPEHFRYESVRGTTVDKFNGVVGVYALGKRINVLRGKPKTLQDAESETPSAESAKLFIDISSTMNEMFKLEQGTHYVVAYDDTNANPKVVFADNLRPGDPFVFPPGGNVSYEINPESVAAINPDGTISESGEGVILPIGGKTGILIEQLWAAVELDTPSIVIYHPDGWNNRAAEIAKSFSYQVLPLVNTDEPAPIAFNGTLLDQVAGKKDHDPTTAQPFDDTPIEQAMEAMDAGGGMTLTLSFLDEDQVQQLSGALFDYMNSGDGTEAVYICGPSCTAELGAVGPNGGIVNTINYSYQDSNSYTISVSCGRKLVGGMSQVDGGIALRTTEEVSAKGTIIQDMGTNVHYKVHVDGIGDRTAINMVPAVLRVGDKVTVAIHNNPVEG